MTASFWMRVLAHNIDLVILLIPFYGLSVYIKNDMIFYPLLLVIYLLYHLVFELSDMKGSPGKYFNKLKVVHMTGTTLTVNRCIIRNLGKVLSILPFFLGFTLAMFNNKNQTLHDRLAGSIVIYSET